MPGLSLIKNVSSQLDFDAVEKIIDSLKPLNNYSTNILTSDQNLVVGWIANETYPIKIININNFTVIIEGKIYNKTSEVLNSELSSIIDTFPKNICNEELKAWLLTNDGDYIIYFIEKKNNDIYIVNDVFGRLPLYISEHNNQYIVSRYLKFINSVSKKNDFDKIAIAEYLLIGYPIGNRTLFKSISHIRPASFIRIEGKNCTISTLHNFNFDERSGKKVKIDLEVKELSELFTSACVNRCQDVKKNIVTLSGGLDSRLVASCLSKTNIKFKTATIKYLNGRSHDEIDIAVKLSEIFKVDYDIVPVPEPTGLEILELLKTKEGMVSLATTPLLPFYKQLIKINGENVHYISGDNGDKVIYTYDKPIKKNRSVHDLVIYYINEYSLLDLDSVCRLVSVTREEILDDFLKVFNEFPEKNLFQKYIHFKAVEKPFKNAFQGEDRHRHYFWNSSPFWSYQFFERIMSIPESSKKMHRLFRKILQSYSEVATDLPYINFKSSINSIKGRVLMWMIFYSYRLIPFGQIKKIKSIFFGTNRVTKTDNIVKDNILVQFKNLSQLNKIFNESDINSSLNDMSYTNLYNLFTLTSAIELTLKNNCVVENHVDKIYN